MGLSNEERVEGIYWAILNLNRNYQENKKRNETINNSFDPILVKDLSVINSYIENLWHSFLGKQSNKSLWLLGSYAHRQIDENDMNPFAVVIRYHCHEAVRSREDVDIRYIGEIGNNDVFDATDYFLDIEGLLHKESPNAAYIYKVFTLSDSLVYNLRRYNDELLADFAELNKIISDIQGECFNIMEHNDIFAKAYLIRNMCRDLYGINYPHNEEKWDSVTKWLAHEAIHHTLSKAMKSEVELGTIAEWHIDFERSKKTIFDRVKLAIQLMSDGFGDSFIQDKFKKRFKNTFKGKQKQEIDRLLSECKKKEAERKQESKFEQNPLGVYGYSAYYLKQS